MSESSIHRDRDVVWSGPELTQRQRNVLRAVVEDYVFTAVPVGSKAPRLALRPGRLAGHRPWRHGGARVRSDCSAIRTHPPAAFRRTSATGCTSSR